MPNHITNQITVYGATSIQDIMKVVGSVDDDGNEMFDFNKIIPMPEELHNTPSVSYPKGDPRQAEQAALIAKNVELYGYPTWYEFANAEWGTKWNAYEFENNGDTIVFHTAWTMPDPIFVKLSTMFPDTTITVQYADEDIGYNCGVRKYKNGECVIDIDMSVNAVGEKLGNSFACEIKYGDANEWRTWEED